MLVDKSRNRLVNAIVYFARHTKNCGKTKLFKLLYLLDFGHFKQTGRSVTGSEYWAWEKGPVPANLEQEWGEFGPDLLNAVTIERERTSRGVRQTVRALVEFNDADFTPRQIELLKSIADAYCDATAEQMVAVAHEQGGPWDRTWMQGNGRSRTIDYALSLTEGVPHREAIAEAAAEYQAMRSSH